MAKRIKTQEISNITNSSIFFDANIWMYLFCPIGGYKPGLVNAYTRCFASILKSDNKIYTDFTVISEFVNAYLRLAGSLYRIQENINKFNYKRDFRGTTEYKDALRDAYTMVKSNILKKAVVCNRNYDLSSMQSLADETDLNCDFNDRHIVSLCNENRMYLLTHDGDFQQTNVDLISHNSIYWKI